MASTYLLRTMGSATSRFTFTLSMWVKRSDYGEEVFWNSYNSNAYRFQLYFDSSDRLVVYNVDNSVDIVEVVTNRKFRDQNGWYHIYVAVKSSEATASDRVKVYINGERETSFAVATYPSTSNDMSLGTSSYTLNIGRYGGGTAYFSGYMSHSHYVDGSIIDVTEFGSTDTTTGEWKINTSPTISSYGNQGHFILKDNASPTDQSGNGNNFSGGGAIRDCEDNPSNVFCTLNRLNSDQPTGSVNMQYGNTGFEDGENGSNFSYVSGTLGANSGKFYWETKVVDLAEIDQVGVALASSSFMGATNSDGLQATTYGGKGVQFSNGNKVGDGSQSAYMGGFSANDVLCVALDLDNNKITFGRNGQWADGSGNANQTYANSTPAYTNLTAGEFYFPAQAKRAYGANYGTNWYNFGNGHFQTTAVSSAGTNASGIGIFEYDVPTGFTALSTKGLNL